MFNFLKGFFGSEETVGDKLTLNTQEREALNRVLGFHTDYITSKQDKHLLRFRHITSKEQLLSILEKGLECKNPALNSEWLDEGATVRSQNMVSCIPYGAESVFKHWAGDLAMRRPNPIVIELEIAQEDYDVLQKDLDPEEAPGEVRFLQDLEPKYISSVSMLKVTFADNVANLTTYQLD
jgi:hypothetical protein